ncbi:MAG: 1-deoxy-D-xylulose-5-phosphate reductoisomerase [Candidatus Margulisbacteria bacterium]|nr:1-deoxy-D-xylulose-5-phosphate reductoisomerase [Candidatus Margulisiibacteriota bacterium]MBU1021737.1 1-deoxy-D-xylulose-5-phosphate reductoisomerase [Candidatus Margulisiibacteriota bacterium]MBU1729483.1 1-deoxy-D-xylulose-5-phosphate reductoisomerase [Candidatus Margulisiibacteriota bacterium]MBU1955416.1 1-deoxy-D-xylulose-5-phosphate reductoisomerase [Candidatus Margulisiibacteriota bacterium]
MKKLAVLGSTGSIGKQTLEVVLAYPSSFNVVALAAKDEVDLIVEQIKKFSPKIVSVADDATKSKVEAALGKTNTKILTNSEGLLAAATDPAVNTVVVAIPGSLSLTPTLEAIKAKKDLALATKEILVAGGDLMMEEIKKAGIKVMPIDSEHSAIYQCLAGEDKKKVKKIILTASGGPFLNTPVEKLAAMTPKEALAHPTWKMGPKITIDSATLMNKGLEVIEAHYLFGIDYKNIEVIIHPQSVIHSMVEFVDGSVMAQLGPADMRLPIQYALLDGKRAQNFFKRIDFTKLSTLNFAKPDLNKFQCLKLAYEAAKKGGTAGAVLNAANEVAVKQFLGKKIGFMQIAEQVKAALDKHQSKANPTIEDILAADKWAREAN